MEPSHDRIRLRSSRPIGRCLTEHDVGHHLVEALGLLEQGPVAGGVELDHLLPGRLHRIEPLVCELGPGARLVASLHQVDRDVETTGVVSQIDMLDLWIQDAERVGLLVLWG